MKKLFVSNTRENNSAENHVCLSIMEAVKLAQPGDVIEIAPGKYREAVVLKTNGITLQSSEAGGVVIMPGEGVKLESEKWEKLSGSELVYEQSLPDALRKLYCAEEDNQAIYRIKSMNLYVDAYCYEFVQVCGMGEHVNFGNGHKTYEKITLNAIDDSHARRWTITPQGKVQINMEGRNPAHSTIELRDNDFTCVTVLGEECVIRGITLEGGNTGVRFRGSRNLIEDCVIKYSQYGGRIRGDRSAVNNIFRRCTFFMCKEGIFISDNMGIHVIEECMFIGTGQPLFTQRSPQSCINEPWGPGSALRMADTHYIVFRYNVMADGTWAGWWPDVNCYGNSFYGNIITNIRDRGLYNEYPVNDTRIYYNAVTDCNDGIIQRFSWRTLNFYNYLEGNRNSGISIWGPHVDNGYVFDNIFAKNVIKNNGIPIIYNDNEGMSGNLPVAWPGDGAITATALARIKSQIFHANIYGPVGKRGFASINGTKFETPDALRDVTGYNADYHIKDNPGMEEFGLGLFTVNIPFSQRPSRSVAVVGNPLRDYLHTDLLPLAAEDAPYFWQQGTWEDQREGDYWKTAYGYSYEWPSKMTPVRRLMRTRPGFDPETACLQYASGDTALSEGPGLYMELVSHLPQEIPEKGSGFWSISLPAVEEMPITVSFCVSSDHLIPLQSDAVIAAIRFSSLEGKTVGTAHLFGQSYQGTNGWMMYKQTVKVPHGAHRMAIFLAMLPCEKDSIVRFGNIYIHSGNDMSKEVPVLPDFKKSELINLQAFFNHELDADTGGPIGAYAIDPFVRSYCSMQTIDLSGIEKGDFTFKGIALRVEKAVTLGCHRRPPVVLPLSMKNIPVNKKSAGLAFFHAGGFMAQAQENFRYLIHYSDGSIAEVVPVGEKSMLVYRQPFFLPDQDNVQAAVEQGSFKGLSCFVWKNPNPNVSISHFDFMSMDTGNAILVSAAILE